MNITKEQHATLKAIATGAQHTLYPMMRRMFLRKQWIVPAGPQPPPAEVRHAKQPLREYAVTELGHAAIASYKGADHGTKIGRLRIAFGNAVASPPEPLFERRSKR